MDLPLTETAHDHMDEFDKGNSGVDCLIWWDVSNECKKLQILTSTLRNARNYEFLFNLKPEGSEAAADEQRRNSTCEGLVSKVDFAMHL